MTFPSSWLANIISSKTGMPAAQEADAHVPSRHFWDRRGQGWHIG